MTVTAGDMRWAFRSGEHVCWLVRSRAEYDAGEQELLTQAAHAGDNVIIVGDRVRTRHHSSSAGAVADMDIRLGGGASPVFEVMREQARSAGEGGRGLRILAQMEYLTPPDSRLEDLIACEMNVAELADHGAISVVCAYQYTAWKRELLSGVRAVHSRVVGAATDTTRFRIVRAGTDGWALHGAVSFEAAQPFAATLRAMLTRSPRLRLDCAGLELIDAAGWHELIAAATTTPGATVILENANKTVAATWRLAGYDDETIPVQVRS